MQAFQIISASWLHWDLRSEKQASMVSAQIKSNERAESPMSPKISYLHWNQ